MTIAAITGQSGAGMLPPLHTYTIACPPGMLPDGHAVKTFWSVTAFDGYISHLRKSGYAVTFSSPFAAVVESVA